MCIQNEPKNRSRYTQMVIGENGQPKVKEERGGHVNVCVLVGLSKRLTALGIMIY